MTAPATVALPIIRTRTHAWRQATAAEVATSPSARDHFGEVIEASDFESLDDFWNTGLNYRNKLTGQVFEPDSWLVVYGAGGGIPAAAHAQIRSFGNEPPIIDQTLYWISTAYEDEALFLVGVINSDVLLERIADFIPQGDFGDRHLHTLPSKAVPQYDAANEAHTRVVEASRALHAELHRHRESPLSRNLFTTNIPMIVRRQRLRRFIQELASNEEYTAACRNLYDTIG